MYNFSDIDTFDIRLIDIKDPNKILEKIKFEIRDMHEINIEDFKVYRDYDEYYDEITNLEMLIFFNRKRVPIRRHSSRVHAVSRSLDSSAQVRNVWI